MGGDILSIPVVSREEVSSSFSYSFCNIPGYIVSKVPFNGMFMCKYMAIACYIFAHYHPTNIILNVAKNSGLRYNLYDVYKGS